MMSWRIPHSGTQRVRIPSDQGARQSDASFACTSVTTTAKRKETAEQRVAPACWSTRVSSPRTLRRSPPLAHSRLRSG